MKKVLFLMVAAVALMACNSNSVDPGTSSSVSQLTANVASAFGKSAAEVKADFEKAGFVQVQNAPDLLTKPAFQKIKESIKKPSDAQNTETYVLNAPKNFDELIKRQDEQAFFDLLNKVVDNGKPLVIVVARYNDNNQFTDAQLNLVAGTNINAGTLFINTSKDFFKALAGDKAWNAEIYVYPTDIDEKNPPKEEDYHFSYELEERSAYESKLPSVVEKTSYITEGGRSEGTESVKSIEYGISYSLTPDDTELREMGIKPYVAGGGYISWVVEE